MVSKATIEWCIVIALGMIIAFYAGDMVGEQNAMGPDTIQVMSPAPLGTDAP